MPPLMNSYDLALLTPEQVAERLGCETDTVNAKAAAHELPAIKYGRSWRFPVEAMNRYLAEKALEHVRTPEHDDSHFDGALARASASYALSSAGFPQLGREVWPWSPTWWKPSDRRRDLVEAGALILAEIERLDRAQQEACAALAAMGRV